MFCLSLKPDGIQSSPISDGNILFLSQPNSLPSIHVFPFLGESPTPTFLTSSTSQFPLFNSVVALLPP